MFSSLFYNLNICRENFIKILRKSMENSMLGEKIEKRLRIFLY